MRPRLGAIRSLAQVLQDLRRYNEADRWLLEERRILGVGASPGTLQNHPARGFRKSRIREVEGFLKPSPNSLTWRKELAALYAEDGQHDKAVTEYSMAISLEPDNPDLYQNRGEAYQAMGDSDRAKADYEEAKRLNETRRAGEAQG